MRSKYEKTTAKHFNNSPPPCFSLSTFAESFHVVLLDIWITVCIQNNASEQRGDFFSGWSCVLERRLNVVELIDLETSESHVDRVLDQKSGEMGLLCLAHAKDSRICLKFDGRVPPRLCDDDSVSTGNVETNSAAL